MADPYKYLSDRPPYRVGRDFYSADEHRGTGGQPATKPEDARPIDNGMIERIYALYREMPALRLSLGESEARLFDKPFQVTIGGKHAHSTLSPRMRELIIRDHWMPVLRILNLHLVLFGVAAWYFRRLQVPVHQLRDGGGANKHTTGRQAADGLIEVLVPAVPPYGSGQIETYVADRVQRFHWKWHEWALPPRRKRTVDPAVFIEVESPPDIFGRITSKMATLVHENTLVRSLEMQLHRGNDRAISPEHFIEFHPNLAHAASDTGAGGATGASASFALLAQTRFPGESGVPRDSRNKLERVRDFHLEQQKRDGYAAGGTFAEDAILPPGAAGASRTMQTSAAAALHQKQLLFLDNHPEMRQLFNVQVGADAQAVASLGDRAHYLHPYQRYVAPPVHSPDTSALLPLIARRDRLAAAICDFPLENVMGVDAHSAGATRSRAGNRNEEHGDSMSQFVISRLRARSNNMADLVQRMFRGAHVAMFKQAYVDSKKLFRARAGRSPTEAEKTLLHANLDVHVIFPRTPLVSFEQMARYFQHRMITAQDFFEFAVDIVGLGDKAPPGELERALKVLYPIDPAMVAGADADGASPAKRARTADNGGSDTNKKTTKDTEDSKSSKKQKDSKK
jgi:hypothetical protein